MSRSSLSQYRLVFSFLFALSTREKPPASWRRKVNTSKCKLPATSSWNHLCVLEWPPAEQRRACSLCECACTRHGLLLWSQQTSGRFCPHITTPVRRSHVYDTCGPCQLNLVPVAPAYCPVSLLPCHSLTPMDFSTCSAKPSASA